MKKLTLYEDKAVLTVGEEEIEVKTFSVEEETWERINIQGQEVMLHIFQDDDSEWHAETYPASENEPDDTPLEIIEVEETPEFIDLQLSLSSGEIY